MGHARSIMNMMEGKGKAPQGWCPVGKLSTGRYMTRITQLHSVDDLPTVAVESR